MDHSELSEGILDAMADGVVVADADGRIVYASKQAERMSGYSRQELEGQRIELLVPAGFRPVHERHRERYMAAPGPRAMGTDLDIRLRRRDGRHVAVDIALSPLRGDHGLRVVAVIRDSEARRETERALREQAQLLELAHDSILVRRVEDSAITFWNQGAVETYGYSRGEAVGKVSHTLLQTDSPEDLSEMSRKLAEEGRWEGELTHTRKDGSKVTVSSRQVLLHEGRADSSAVLEINRDITEQKRASDRLSSVLEVAQAILGGLEADRVLELVAHRARELVGAALASIAMPEIAGESFVVRVAEGTNANELLGMRLPAGRSIIGRTLATHTPTVVGDLMSDPHAFPDFVKAARMGPALFVPLTVEKEDLGTLMVANPRGSRPFSGEELTLLQLFAAAAAVSIEYTRAREALDRMILLEDRERIARELHDGAIQTLFGVGMSLQSTALISQQAEVTRRLEDNVSTVDQVIHDLRNYIFGLRPAVLRAQGLDQALRRLIEEFERESGVASVVDMDPAAAAAISDKSSDVLQLAAEALSNVRRHANAETCRISLRLNGGTAVLQVEDDGRGFEPDHDDGAGQGLRNFRERTAGLGGELKVKSAAGQGTTLTIAIPT